MIKNIQIILFMLAVVTLGCTKQKEEKTPSGLVKKLVWADEFNQNGLPNSKYWDYEVGFVRNKEEQYYTKERLENVRIENDLLIIESKKEDYKNAEYTSASINTFKKVAFEGDFRVEVKAKLPKGKGIWPAIWMMGINREHVGWPKCSELDIMEFVGHTPNKVYQTMHWADKATDYKHKSKGSHCVLDDIHTNFHIYGLERVGNNIKVFIDDKYLLNFDAPTTAYEGSFVKPVYLLLNTAIGGSWGGEVDEAIFPQRFEIDYVRYYSLSRAE